MKTFYLLCQEFKQVVFGVKQFSWASRRTNIHNEQIFTLFGGYTTFTHLRVQKVNKPINLRHEFFLQIGSIS
ncbi:unnamed protein product [Cylicocyclus nassatus]|uniref:Uncharacterized protein n=1 Tax=Cylicocyclus nassatus TaxID=53992 RepID=A0AA36H1M7_CYLNA|nr:unnamed protein product [Cylicocyclus nassatus]